MAALRDITGKDTASTAEAWTKLLNSPQNDAKKRVVPPALLSGHKKTLICPRRKNRPSGTMRDLSEVP
jgi:hypothetical protein